MESPAGIFSRGRVKYMTRGLSPDEIGQSKWSSLNWLYC
jgi:hypothetical protein